VSTLAVAQRGTAVDNRKASLFMGLLLIVCFLGISRELWMPDEQPIYALGKVDETLEGSMPFLTGREVIAITLEDIPAERPPYILVQDKEGGRTAPQIGAPYALLRDHSFGPGRYFAFWRRQTHPTIKSN